MTPWSLQFKFRRQAAGLTQADIAATLSVTTKVISALERGARQPLGHAEMRKLAKPMRLTATTLAELNEVAALSSWRPRIPRAASLEEIKVANAVVRAIGSLKPDDLEEIMGVVRRRQGRRTTSAIPAASAEV